MWKRLSEAIDGARLNLLLTSLISAFYGLKTIFLKNIENENLGNAIMRNVTTFIESVRPVTSGD